MGLYLTLLLVVAALAVLAAKTVAANRRAARAAAEAAERRREREAMEKDLLTRLGKLKERDETALAARAIGKDPARAAKVVGRMMRNKGDS